MKTFREYLQESGSIGQYVYHATDKENRESIKRVGLYRSEDRTSGQSDKYFNVSTTEADSEKWAKALKKDVQLRFKATKDTKEGTYSTTRNHYANVKPFDLEIKTNDGWVPLIEDKIRQPRSWFELGDLVNQYMPPNTNFFKPKPDELKIVATRLGISVKDASRAKTAYDSNDFSMVKDSKVPTINGTLSGK
jgi:hypothetical protein